MIEGLFNSGSMPVLERLAEFTQKRHTLLTHDIANLSTPGFRPVDLNVSAFQKQLGEAIDARRSAHDGQPVGDLPGDPGSDLTATPMNDGILFHDGNNRSLEHVMQSLAENTMTYNASMDLLKNQFKMLETAISGRV